MAAAKTAMSSKIVGADSDFFGKLVVDAVTSVRSQDEATGRVRYPVSAINILKAHGKSAKESRMLDGYALNLGRAAQVRPRGWGGACRSGCCWLRLCPVCVCAQHVADSL
jgi:T-complex protein 1 subunit alpha